MKKLILLISLIFASLILFGQREIDTVKVTLLVCDTAKPFYVNTYSTFDTLINDFWIGHIEYDTIYYDSNFKVYWTFGYEIREKHNTIEGIIDPYFNKCYKDGKEVDCYHDYWVHIKYLNFNKQEFPKEVIIWDCKKR